MYRAHDIAGQVWFGREVQHQDHYRLDALHQCRVRRSVSGRKQSLRVCPDYNHGARAGTGNLNDVDALRRRVRYL